MRSMGSERRAVVGVLVAVVLLGVPVFAFAASMRGGGVDRSTLPGFTQTIHLKLDQPSGGVASGTINVSILGSGATAFYDLTVTDGDLTLGIVMGTMIVTDGPRGNVVAVCSFDGLIVPGGAGVGHFRDGGAPCPGLSILLDQGHIGFSP